MGGSTNQQVFSSIKERNDVYNGQQLRTKRPLVDRHSAGQRLILDVPHDVRALILVGLPSRLLEKVTLEAFAEVEHAYDRINDRKYDQKDGEYSESCQ